MRGRRGAALLGLAGAFLLAGGLLVVVAMYSDKPEANPLNANPPNANPTASVTQTEGTDPAPSIGATEFNPSPDVCLDSLEPPPCEETAVSWLLGYLELAPTRLTTEYPALPVIKARIEANFGPSESFYPPPNADDFEARAWDAQGREVVGVSLDLMGIFAVAAGTGVDSGGYFVNVNIFLPGTAGFSRVALLENDTIVHEWSAGPQAPVIESLTMTEGADGPLIEWKATDPDGDDLKYWVMLIDANGSRRMLDFGPTTDTSILVNPRNSNGPGPHRAFVGATDGINVSWAVTDPVATTNQPPYFLASDGAEYTMTSGGSFRLLLWVIDPEGERLGDQVIWTSSIDGYLMSGSELEIYGGSAWEGPTLSVGTHQITASVTDSGGASASVSFTLVVKP